jgi:hypothetical protein
MAIFCWAGSVMTEVLPKSMRRFPSPDRTIFETICWSGSPGFAGRRVVRHSE